MTELLYEDLACVEPGAALHRSFQAYFRPGFAARNAITCVALAATGVRGSPEIFDGEAGMFAAFSRKPAAGPIELFPLCGAGPAGDGR